MFTKVPVISFYFTKGIAWPTAGILDRATFSMVFNSVKIQLGPPEVVKCLTPVKISGIRQWIIKCHYPYPHFQADRYFQNLALC